jgi:rubrerythrin
MDVAKRRTLSRAPTGGASTLAELVGIAGAIEAEAIRRYHWLAREMRRRGATATAEALDALAREEESHVAAVAGWAESLGEAVPPAADFAWRLPADLAESWDGAARSALLTPYRAYAIAVDNEERAFAFYAYLAAASEDPRVAEEAEHLAQEELRHAARLRILRRAAWRQENEQSGAPSTPLREAETPEALAQLLAAREAEIAACHRLLALRLRELDDQESAALLDELAAEAARRSSATGKRSLCLAEACEGATPLALLLAAQRPLERLCEQLEALHLGAPSEALQSMAETFLADAVARIARLGRRIERLEAD